jgi:inorganic triphosphatase YgiF
METELKFLLSAKQQREVARHLETMAAATSESGNRHEITEYFDFPNLALRDAGFSLRVRGSGGKITQTLKSLDAAGGAATTRLELEWTLARSRPDISRMAGTPAAKVFAANSDAAIREIFTTDINRTAYRLALEHGATAELVIDVGEIRAGDRAQPVRELEIESKTGPVEPLYRFATALHETCPLTISRDSKAARGYRLFTGAAPVAQKAGDIDLARNVTLADAFREIVDSGLGQFVANLSFCTADDPEPLHQTRVAIRRIRSALALFAPYMEPEATARFEEALKQFGRTLGEGRDRDVFVTETLRDTARDPQAAAWTELIMPLAEAARREAYVAIDRLIRSREPTDFALALAGWSHGTLWVKPGKAADTLPGRAFAELAPDLLDRLASKALKRGRRLASRPMEELHSLRKTVKKLRYCAEYCGSLYPRKQVERYLAACKTVLDLLGAINDTVGTETLADRLIGDDRSLIPVAGLFARISAESRENALKGLPKAWGAFAAETPFWQ